MVRSQTLTLRQHLNQAEKTYLKEMLGKCRNLKNLAEYADVSYSTLWRKMKKYGLNHV